MNQAHKSRFTMNARSKSSTKPWKAIMGRYFVMAKQGQAKLSR